MVKVFATIAQTLFLLGWCHLAVAQSIIGGGVYGDIKKPSSARSFVTASVAMQYLTTTWTHAPTDPLKATISYWQKFIITPPGIEYEFTTALTGGNIFDHNFSSFSFHTNVTNDAGGYSVNGGPGNPPDLNWHHICVQIDTTAGSPVVIWVDGIDSGTSGTQPTASSDMGVTANGIASYIGEVSYQIGNTTGIPDAEFAYFYLIDGQALPASSFTTGTGMGTIHPLAYSGTYGNNGFFLNGTGNSTTVFDQSPAGNNFTAPNLITYSSDLPPP